MISINKLKDLLFQNTSTKQTIAKNMFWLVVSQIGSRLIRATIIIYAARVLGTEGYGVFSYALGLAAFFTIFSDIGISAILVREIAQKSEERKCYFSTAFWIKIILLIISSIFIVFLAPYFSNIKEAIELLPFVALIMAFDNLREFFVAYFRGRNKMEFEALAVVITNITIAIFGFVILSYKPTAYALTVSYAIGVSVSLIAVILMLHEEFLGIFVNFKKKLLKPILHSALPIAISSVFGAFMVNIDIIMIGWFRNVSEVGLYSAGQKIVQVLYALPAIIASSTFPTFSEYIGKGRKNLVKYLMERTIAISLLVSLPITVGGIILASSIINLIYGSTYQQSIYPFQILLSSIPLVFIGSLFMNFILGYNQQKKMAIYAIIGSIINMVLNALFIPIWGMVGAAITTIIAQSSFNFMTWRFSKSLNNFYTIRYLKKIIPATILMGLISYVLDRLGLNVILNIVTAILSYVVTLYFLKESIVAEVIRLIKINLLNKPL